MILAGDVRDEVTCSSLLFFPSLLPSDLCMKNLLCLVIYKKILYPLEVQNISVSPQFQRLLTDCFFSFRIMQTHDTGCKFGTSNFGVPF